ncbi:uncharacterized protein PHACADRAFT_260261 [Phanerochaete carnosa HHB-10118-sp]|uniref:Linoleate diol synthase n=1 Tax=Phanerochaete carnosa (strain HHB-10118-sp) TaxID=650164 RepID=K5WTK9_PHACS|nr:uncharacterized protein PHACADRAFT_260261 [Phanerochaete carnosa HHB-10118-sp]EKM53767.1 hypothetical protein PHACADRAFT_260261 [Phanerochaete carnosa HHB-10118-sp]
MTTPSIKLPSKLHSSEGDHSGGSLKILDEFRETVKRDVSFVDVSALPGIIDALKHNSAIDDRKMLLEHILMFISKLPEGTVSTKLQNLVIELLYNDLPHPPSTYLGQQYAWRTADGSYNNICEPDMGKAGMPYSRSVQQTHPLATRDLPDAGLVFDTLLRREKFVKHPAGLSSMMFSFAALVIHSVFRTSHENVNINETSSYLDLAPLYGCNQEAQNKIRVRDGRGLLYPDTFAEDRLLLLPPAVAVLLLLFSRNHNYIARKLLEINERDTYTDPDHIPADDPQRSAKILAQEEEIFQTARLINCGWFGSAILSDYFSAILGLVRQGSSWSLNPFGEIRQEDHSLFERARGNACSVEFNCLYRWHATTSEHDEQWVEQLTRHLFGNRSPDTISMADLKQAMQKIQAQEPDATHWTFGNMQRQEDGSFKDEELAAILRAATQHPAGAFKARGTPHCMRLHEIMGIEASRRWGLCSLNDFRKFLGLKPYSSFLEWNPDPEVAAAAEKLYGDIGHLELYTGLQAEETKPVVDGAGVCPSYTISRAILADAIALTRGDRFFTADYTPFNMTSWGFADCQRDAKAPGYGSTLGRLLMRALPNHYTANSTYTWFPLMTPEAMQTILTKLGDIDLYNLKLPSPVQNAVEVDEYRDATHVLVSGNFGALYQERAGRVIEGQGFFLASNDPARAQREQRAMLGALAGAPGSVEKIAEFFYRKTREMMVSEAWTGVGRSTKSVDVARDVLKYVPIYWACEVAGIHLNNNDSEDGYTPAKLYTMLTEIYEFLFLDFDSYKYLTLLKTAQRHIDVLLRQIKGPQANSGFSLFSIFSFFAKLFGGGQKSEGDLSARFTSLGYDNDTLANSILAILVGCTVEMSQALVHVVNFYLDEGMTGQVKISTTNARPDGKDQETMQGIAVEALRLDPPFAGVYREALTAQNVNDRSVETGGKVFVNIAKANMDPDVFKDPASVKPNRSPKDRYLAADGSVQCLGFDLSSKIVAEVLRAVFSFPNVRRAPGQSGVLKRFKPDTIKTSSWMYLNHEQLPSPWATSMIIQYD